MLVALTFILLIQLPVNFSYLGFAALIFFNSVGMGMFIAPNQTGIMNSLPANQRGAGAGMAGTFNSSAQVLSIGIFFTPDDPGAGRHAARPRSTTASPPRASARRWRPGSRTCRRWAASSPPSWATTRCRCCSATPSCRTCRTRRPHYLTSRQFFPHLIAPAFSKGLTEAFSFAAGACLLGAVASLLRGGKYHYEETTADVATRARRRGPGPGPGGGGRDRAVAGGLTWPCSTQRKAAGDVARAGGGRARPGIRISDAATRVGVSARTLRYYEELGLLDAVALHRRAASVATRPRTWPTCSGSSSCARCSA